MTEVTAQNESSRESTAVAQGSLVDYAWKLKKRGLSDETIRMRSYRLGILIRKGANLSNPDTVETVLATENWSNGHKRGFIQAYQSFTKTYKIDWDPPKVQYQSQQPFLPEETEADQLIAGCGRRTATFLQTLKDTGARCGEVAKLRWVDVDEAKKVIRINNPEKGSNSRTVPVTPKTLAMLNALPKRSQFVFSPVGSVEAPRIRTLQSVFARQRNKLAVTLQNPRLKEIHFHTFRHMKGSAEYGKTLNLLYVKQLLGHKRIESTEVYTHLVNFANEEYTVMRPATSVEEDKLVEAGYQYVRYDEKEQRPIYRKRK